MNRWIAVLASALIVILGGAGAWYALTPGAPPPEDDTVLPVPPFPPRIAQGQGYEHCLATLADDPAGAVGLAEALQAAGGSEGAAHCRGLALIALGKPDQGAEVLEQLAGASTAPPLARAIVLGQAAQARLMVMQADQAATDLTQALVLSPQDAALLIMRAQAEDALHRYPAADADLTAALNLDADRTEALVARAAVRRKLGQLDLARDDVGRALAIDPDDADALLERGIVRQLQGDVAGARADWQHALGVDPNSTTADLAQQNLSLLEVGPPAR
ncbi:MAG TPA: tetratricopeptide repeat protein [Rhodopila sp.]|uniref:tetratricopeptide repeat protein n=1 Tax=Rhodopila sp. TaxID=2480087 RepID=UPI002C397DFC|nr:tetratricopeptide repeat protein [Rhodopila sp.]HVY13887.1 tetratricopeptide repeat protein [Rhodopila sp.]